MSDVTRTPFLARLIRAAKLEPALYEEVEADTLAINQALLVVALSSLATGIGAFGRIGVRGLLSGVVAGIIGWMLWSLLTYVIGARLLPAANTVANWGELLRTTGFATAPGILAVLGYAPVLTGFIAIVTQCWMFAAFVVAVRQALDYTSTWRAIAVCLLGGLVYAALIWALTS